MTCLEAQSKIMAYIDGKLPDDELMEFIKHVKSCENCSEELEIYYTLIVGMKKLDNEENLSINFKEELKAKMDDELTRMTAAKRIATSTIIVIMAAILVGLVWVYNGTLDKVYRYEQRSKKESQTKHYYKDTFGDVLFYDTRYMSEYIDGFINQEEVKPEPKKNIEFMQKVQKYNVSHKTYIEIIDEATEAFAQEVSDEENTNH